MPDPLRDVDILIKTFLRPDCLRRLVGSIVMRYPDAHLIIADDSQPDGEMLRYYDELEGVGHRILLLPFNVGTAAGRNALVDAATRPYLLVLDDDFVFSNQTRIETLVEVLETDSRLGVAAGSLLDRGRELRSYEFVTEIRDELLHCHPIRRDVRTIAGHACYDAEIVLNFALFRAELFSTIRWDDSLRTKDHEDLFLQLSNSPGRAVHAPGVMADHYLELPAVYRNYRMDADDEERFRRKWNVRDVVLHDPRNNRDHRRWTRRVYLGSARHALRARRLCTAGSLLVTAARTEAGHIRRTLKAAVTRR